MVLFSVSGVEVTLHQVWLYGMVPGCVFKQIVNVAQLTSACWTLAAQDAAAKNGKAA